MAEKRQYCGSKTVYHQHKRLYFDTVSKKWASEQVFFKDDSDLDSFKPGVQASNSTIEDNGTTLKYYYFWLLPICYFIDNDGSFMASLGENDHVNMHSADDGSDNSNEDSLSVNSKGHACMCV